MWILAIMTLSAFSEPALVNPTPATLVSRETATQFGYEAIEDKKRRKPPSAVTQHEDRHLNQSQRRKLQATTQDVKRNYAVAAWMIRRHLDYVTQFDFHARTKDEELNNQLESALRTWARPGNCDVTGRFGLRKQIRIAECCSVLDGDVGLLALSSGHLQGIESDRIRDPSGARPEEWYNGADQPGRATGRVRDSPPRSRRTGVSVRAQRAGPQPVHARQGRAIRPGPRHLAANQRDQRPGRRQGKQDLRAAQEQGRPAVRPGAQARRGRRRGPRVQRRRDGQRAQRVRGGLRPRTVPARPRSRG